MNGFREESSVRVEKNEYGEFVPVGTAHGPVIMRTPEELGIPRIVKDVPSPVLRASWAGFELDREYAISKRRGRVADRPRREEQRISRCMVTACGSEKASPATRGALRQMAAVVAANEVATQRPEEISEPAPTLQIIRGVEVVMPAHATMGAEMIDEFAKEAAEMVRGGRNRVPDDVRQRIESEPPMKVAELVKKYGISQATIYGILAKAKKPRKAGAGKPVTAQPAAVARCVGAGAQQQARLMMTALEKFDEGSGNAGVTIELSAAEITQMMGRFNDSQKSAFITAGLRAALLA